MVEAEVEIKWESFQIVNCEIPKHVKPMPSIIKAVVGSTSLMMLNTVTATPIASPTALKYT